MQTKWKYATIPADQRIAMLGEGNEELYKEEMARTEDVIKMRLDLGLDVDEQMKWADTVSYNYNLGKAKQIGISPENVHSDGYAERYFGTLTGSTYTPKNTQTKKTSAESASLSGDIAGHDANSLYKSVTDAYVDGINQRAKVLQGSYKDYIGSIRSDYAQKKKAAIKAYEDYEKAYNEALLNSGRSASGGKSLTEKLMKQDMLNDYLAELEAQKNSALGEAKNSLMSQLYQLSSTMMSQASDDYYRYLGLLQDEKASEYAKQKDATDYGKWLAEFGFQLDRAAADDKKDADALALERDSETNDLYLQLLALADKKSDRETEYEKWLKEFEADNSYRRDQLAADTYYNNARLALDRDKFEYETSPEEASTEGETETEGADGTPPGDHREFGTAYVKHLNVARKAANSVRKSPDGRGYQKMFTDDELIAWIYTFELSDNEKAAIVREIGLKVE